MKTAIDNYEIGKQKEVDADDFSFVIRDKYRFICPECYEPVTMVDGKNFKFFKHGKKTENTIACDKRVESNQNSSIFEKNGLPVFLRHRYGEFGLFLGFRPIPLEILDLCNGKKVFIEVSTKNNVKKQKYYVTYDNFSDKEMIYKKLEISTPNNLNIVYSDAFFKCQLVPYWSDFVEYPLMRHGAFFQDGLLGGKMLKSGDCVSTHKSYLWVKQKTGYDSFIPHGIVCNRKGTFEIDDKKFEVIKCSFEVTASSRHEFHRLGTYLKEHFGLFLVESNSSITPLWPPCKRTPIGYETNHFRKLFYLINSCNVDPKIYTYFEKITIPLESKATLVNDAYVGCNSVNTSGQTINIDRRVVSNGSYIRSKEFEIKKNKGYIDDDLDVKYITFKQNYSFDYTISEDFDIFMILQNRSYLREQHKANEINFLIPNRCIAFFVVTQNKLVLVGRKLEEEYSTKNGLLSYNEVKDALLKAQYSVEITLNREFRKKLEDLISNNKDLGKMLLPYFRKNKIPLQFIRFLGGKINEGN